MTCRILGVQLDNIEALTPALRDDNLQRALRAIEQAPGYDVYCLPEMSTVGYSDDMFANLDELVEDPLSGPSFSTFAPLAKRMGCYICYGFPCAPGQENGGVDPSRPTIAAGVVGPDGTLQALYHKLHLCSFGDCKEALLFTPGQRATVFEVNGVRIGVTICYDIRFPELYRELALRLKCDIILHPAAMPDDGSHMSWHQFVLTRALENQVPILSVNRGHPHFGRTYACPAWLGHGPAGASATSELGLEAGVLELIVDVEEVRRMREHLMLRTDRRTDYTTLQESTTPGKA